MILVEHAHLYTAAATHPGMRGKVNEDRYSISAYRFDSRDHTPSVLALVADGIGGHHGGEVAAQLAIDQIKSYIAHSNSSHPDLALKYAMTYTNQIILKRSSEEPALSGMGTTCVCAWVIGHRLYAASVGDSRLYLQRNGRMTCLTTDHTWVQEALAQGTLKPDQIKGHPNAHIIRRFLGTSSGFQPDLRLHLNQAESDAQAESNQGLRLLPSDQLILCSDGLTDLVTDEEILNVLLHTTIDQAPARLVSLANQRNGHDNITVVAMEVPAPAHITQPIPVTPLPTRSPTPRPRRSALSWTMIGLLIVAIVLLCLLLLYTLSH